MITLAELLETLLLHFKAAVRTGTLVSQVAVSLVSRDVGKEARKSGAGPHDRSTQHVHVGERQ